MVTDDNLGVGKGTSELLGELSVALFGSIEELGQTISSSAFRGTSLSHYILGHWKFDVSSIELGVIWE